MENAQLFCFISRLFHLLVFFINVSTLTANSDSRNVRDVTEGSSYFFYQHSEYPRDCQEILSQCSASNSFSSGVYLIKPDGYPAPFEVFCDNVIESEGWTVIQRRIDGYVNFKRSWTEYKEGFGFLSSEFWLGNEKISFLTNQKTYELQIDMVNAAGSSFFVHYDRFRISDDWGEFKLGSFGEYSGNASSVVRYCPTNMEYGNCFCQASCSGGCQKNCVDGTENCTCPNGLFLDQNSNCVSEQECSCYAEGFGVIRDGESQVSSDCSRRCSCNNNQVRCVTSQCSSDATCQEISGAHECQCNEGFIGDGLTCERPTTEPPVTISDCLDLYNSGIRADGVYDINPSGLTGSEFQVYCDMTTDGGGWTVLQRRRDRSESFNRNWAAYKSGFGSLSGDHWLGNDKIHTITTPKTYQLRVDLVDSRGSSYHALYTRFGISDESNKYQLSLGSYSGTAGNSMYNNGYTFSTFDRDNDRSTTYNCAVKHRSAWWYPEDPTVYIDAYQYCWDWHDDGLYRRCSDGNLNGDYSGGNGQNLFWSSLPVGRECNIGRTEMKIRPI